MGYMETRLCSPGMRSGHFLCPANRPLTLPSPRWGEGEGTA